ncbi:efflux RND transporter periplasmic adaptor subunit [Marinilabilia sp.]|uniref:efflux RND transporter periplasmic adaptor subunit n=1 Tax=Marinilabilia sp. TaxID=2021252 RepID=UPI0025BA6AFB|nr:efflux RND transporter periplasmic adaptor subunit [Marinilabilia sp.]
MIRLSILLILPIFALLMEGCGANAPADELEIKQEQLDSYRKEMNELKEKIATLEAELSTGTPSNAVNVETSTLQPTDFEQYIEASGIVSTDQNIIVSPETAGIINSISVTEGDNVKKGQVLASLNTESLEQSMEEVKVNLQMATTLFERRKNLWEQNIGSEVELLQAESSMMALQKKLQGLEAQMNMAVVKAPISGIIDNLLQKQGEMAGPTIPFARIVNLEEVYITADVSEEYLNKINSGDSVTVFFPVLGIKKTARIFRTSAMIDPDSRTFSIRANLNNPDQKLQPNLMGEMKMRISHIQDALVVPSILVKKDFNGEFLFVVSKDETGIPVARKIYIKSGIKDNNNTVVTKGLEKGTEIITKGYGQVTDGSPLNIK